VNVAVYVRVGVIDGVSVSIESTVIDGSIVFVKEFVSVFVGPVVYVDDIKGVFVGGEVEVTKLVKIILCWVRIASAV